MASALLSNVFSTGRPPPDRGQESGDQTSIAHILRLDASNHDPARNRLDMNGNSQHRVPSTPNLAIPDLELTSPSTDIIRIFRHARPGVRLTPVSYSITANPTRPQLACPILLPSHLRSIAAFTACYSQRPALRVRIRSRPDPIDVNKVARSIGYAAPAA